MTTSSEALRVKYSDPVDPWQMLDDTPWGRIPAWKAATLATGSMGVFEQVRNDAAKAESRIAEITAREAELDARADAISARERQHAVSVARFTDFVSRAAALFDKLEKARADAEREPLALPPDNQHKLPEPELKVEGDAIPGKASGDERAGDSLRLKMPVAMDQAEFSDPELPHPPEEFKPPIAAGLDQDNQS
jgi:hypothetical protein